CPVRRPRPSRNRCWQRYGQDSFGRIRQAPSPSATIKDVNASILRSPPRGGGACMASSVASWRLRLTGEVRSTSPIWPSTSPRVATVHAEHTTLAALPSRHGRHLHLKRP